MYDFMKCILVVLFSQVALGVIAAQEKGLPEKYLKLGNDAVLVSVNGYELTKGNYEGLVQVKLRKVMSKRPNLAQRQKDNLEEKFRRSDYQNFIPLALFATESMRLGLKPSEEHRKALKSRYVASYGNPGERFEDFCARLPPLERNAVTNFFELDLLNQTYLQTTMATQLVVSAEEVSNQVAVTVAYNSRMALTNQLICAQASNVLARARAGADFSELADEYSQDDQKEPGGDIGFCTASDFSLEAPSYWENIVSLRPGEVTDVMKTEDGFEIVKFLGEKEDVYGDGSVIARHLARIVWRRAIIFDEDYEFIKRELTRERRSEVVGAAARRLRQKADVKYPCGEDVLYPSRKKK